MARTLVLERHDWETSASGHQIQFPKKAFVEFFGRTGYRPFRVYDPPVRKRPKRIARGHIAGYVQSATYRLNGILEIGRIGHGYVFIEERAAAKLGSFTYDIWWLTGNEGDRVARKRWQWNQAKASQYGPGRRWAILRRRGPRIV